MPGSLTACLSRLTAARSSAQNAVAATTAAASGWSTGSLTRPACHASAAGHGSWYLSLDLHSFQRYALVCETSGRTYFGPGTAPWP
jgi:hypothetical protein